MEWPHLLFSWYWSIPVLCLIKAVKKDGTKDGYCQLWSTISLLCDAMNFQLVWPCSWKILSPMVSPGPIVCGHVLAKFILHCEYGESWPDHFHTNFTWSTVNQFDYSSPKMMVEKVGIWVFLLLFSILGVLMLHSLRWQKSESLLLAHGVWHLLELCMPSEATRGACSDVEETSCHWGSGARRCKRWWKEELCSDMRRTRGQRRVEGHTLVPETIHRCQRRQWLICGGVRQRRGGHKGGRLHCSGMNLAVYF